MLHGIRRVLKAIIERSLRILLYPFTRCKSPMVTEVLVNESFKMVVRNSQPYSGACIGKQEEFQRPASAFTIRWDKVADVIRESDAKNLLDIGCAEGYMIQRSALDCGVFSVGLEMDWMRIRSEYAARELNRGYLHGIVPMLVDSDAIKSLPVFDIVICFSVLHHIIRHHGIEEAQSFLESIVSITGKYFLFDMGSPDEIANDPEWAQVLKFFQGNVVSKTSEFLKSAGFRNVRHIADTPGYVAPGIRPLFICET